MPAAAKVMDAVAVQAEASGLTVVPVKSGWVSKINWVQFAGPMCSLLAAFGLALKPDELVGLVVALQTVQSIATWIDPHLVHARADAERDAMIDGSTGVSIAAIAIVLAGAWAVWMRVGALLAGERMAREKLADALAAFKLEATRTFATAGAIEKSEERSGPRARPADGAARDGHRPHRNALRPKWPASPAPREADRGSLFTERTMP